MGKVPMSSTPMGSTDAEAEEMDESMDAVSGASDAGDITRMEHIPDESIRSHIYQFLRANPEVDQREVQVAVKDGVVTLSGMVDAVPEKRRAREVAETVPGVREVVDNMDVRNFVERTNEELKNEIIAHLSRDAFVESLPNLEIYVSDGEVRLEGTCKTWHERHAIADDVWWIPGVRNVEVLIHPTEEQGDLREGDTAFYDKKSL